MFFGKSKESVSRRYHTESLASSLDRRQQALRAQEERLQREREYLEQLLREAPRIKEEQNRRRREQFDNDSRRTRPPGNLIRQSPHSHHVDTTFGQKRLRAEKRDGLNLFFFLTTVFVIIVLWICRLVFG